MTIIAADAISTVIIVWDLFIIKLIPFQLLSFHPEMMLLNFFNGGLPVRLIVR